LVTIMVTRACGQRRDDLALVGCSNELNLFVVLVEKVTPNKK